MWLAISSWKGTCPEPVEGLVLSLSKDLSRGLSKGLSIALAFPDIRDLV